MDSFWNWPTKSLGRDPIDCSGSDSQKVKAVLFL